MFFTVRAFHGRNLISAYGTFGRGQVARATSANFVALCLRVILSRMSKNTTHKRPSWDEYFMSIADVVGGRATCDRGRSGCVAVRDKRILATGYVGAPAGIPSCDEVGHELHTVTHADATKTQHCVRTTHAEQNVIAQAARVGVSLDGATLYVHMTPCYACAKILVNAGIKRVVAKKDYHASVRSKEVLRDAQVLFELVSTEVEEYSNQTTDDE